MHVSFLQRGIYITRRARGYYSLFGLSATIRKVSFALLEIVKKAYIKPLVPNNVLSESGYTFEVKPIALAAHFAGGSDCAVLVQALRVDFRAITGFEIFLRPIEGESNGQSRVTLLDGFGRVLADDEFSADQVKVNEYYAIRLSRPISVPADERVIVVLQLQNGIGRNGVGAWISKTASGRVFRMSGKGFGEIARALSGRSLAFPMFSRGSMVVRIKGLKSEPVTYRMPRKDEWTRHLSGGVRNVAVIAQRDDIAVFKTYHPDVLPSNVREHACATTAISALKNGEHDCFLLLGGPFGRPVLELLQEAKNSYVPCVYWPIPHQFPASAMAADCSLRESVLPADVRQLIKASDLTLCDTSDLYDLATRDNGRPLLLEAGASNKDSHNAMMIWKQIVEEYKRLHLPKVSIVTILSNKPSEIGPVIQSYACQTYDGQIEIVFVGDKSSDNAVALVCKNMEKICGAAVAAGRISYKVVRNDRNIGTCTSRNIGVREATGDIVVMVDADCLLNPEFLQRHVEAHAFDDCDIVAGPLSVDTNGAEPSQVLRQYEERPWLALDRSGLRDPIDRASFLNCGAHNLSIKAKVITEELFDPHFTYSTLPNSEYRWEDIDMGYRLYQRGLRIKFVEEAFVIRITSAHEDASASECLRSIRNCRRLYEKHPELGLVARRWSGDTFKAIFQYADKRNAETNEDRRFLDNYFKSLNGPTAIKLGRARYRVLSYRWHVPHQYELYKLPIDVTLVTNVGSPMTECWGYGQRPLPPNVRFRRVEDIDPRDYDFAILHFDENVLAYENTNGALGPEYGTTFTWMRDHVDLPKVAICHGTPQFYGQDDISYSKPDLLTAIEAERVRLVEYLGDIPVVLNSYQAQREWGFHRSRVIWHGFDPTEFPPATYERGILSPMGPWGMTRPHYRGYFLHKAVFDKFPDEFKPESLHVPEPHVLYSGNTYAVEKFRNYIDEIRRYSVYFNPTQRSPMPRARCEPMMCGVVTVNAHNHDVDLFIKNGVNGFYSNDSQELRSILIDLMRNPNAVRQIGFEARKTAIDIFNHDRYLAEWRTVISEISG